MSRIGTVGFAWMLRRYSFGDFAMSVVERLPEVASGRGKSGVTGLATCRSLGSTCARRATYRRTGSLLIMLPTSTPRLVMPWMLVVATSRSRTADVGESTTARVDADAIWTT